MALSACAGPAPATSRAPPAPVVGPVDRPAAALEARPQSDASDCGPPAGWVHPATGSAIAGPELLDDVATRAVVLLGEQHDDPDHHLWQLQTLAALHARRPAMIIGFEVFPRRVQPVLDRWVRGELGRRELLAQAEWGKIWGVDADLYLPLFEFARLNRLPMLALNVDRSLNKAVAASGWDAIAADDREGVSTPAPALPAYRDSLFPIWREHAAADDRSREAATPDDPAFARFVQSQLLWDRAMAEPLARAAQGTGAPLAVGIVGSGHLQHGYGVPHQLRDLGIESIGTLIPLSTAPGCTPLAPGLADAVFVTPPRPLATHPPPRLGVVLEEGAGGIVVTQVVAGSLAEQAGLAVGDRLERVAGAIPDGVGDVIDAIRRQPAGTWLPLRVRRGAAGLDLVVRFPPGP